ncbi:SGNH/GDSL hydrolase family protein [Rhizobium sp. CFBP 8762]|uniref:SGNH/GDSL hydrolase family protein n=1 Tax=Rhizobium sp. CFBP 8762 TaxID=2775279 RepID=UPI001786BF8B|nr:SGNH/GDSL hydrolase family protein [Rhizobium sp. CFBP 8762]MBD8555670.1 SGNH/GDSL hydrolase family protein [Rhizobium sp. CFBP 8762]
MTKTIVCYGDSLTWGFDAATPGGRHSLRDRWPKVLADALGSDVDVIVEGLNGRTTAYDDYLAPCDRNGARILSTVLHSHSPLDLIIIMLGTNDLKPVVAGTAFAACQGMERLVEIIRHHPWTDGNAPKPEILIVAPPVICETANAQFAAMFAGGVEQSALLAPLYADLADELQCGFFDAGSVARTTSLDGVHLDAANTVAIGRGLEPMARLMLGL